MMQYALLSTIIITLLCIVVKGFIRSVYLVLSVELLIGSYDLIVGITLAPRGTFIESVSRGTFIESVSRGTFIESVSRGTFYNMIC